MVADTDTDEEWDDADDGPLPPRRCETPELYFEDSGVGWADMVVVFGLGHERFTFTMVFDPLDDIRAFARSLAEGGPARLRLPGEPGGFEVIATPDCPEGWVRLEVWNIDFANRRCLEFEAFGPAATLAASLRAKTGFLAKEDAEPARGAGWFGAVRRWFARGAGKT